VGDRGGELRFLATDVTHFVAFGDWTAAIARQAELKALPDLTPTAALELLCAVPALVHRGEGDDARSLLALLPDGESTQDVQTRALDQAMLATILHSEHRLGEALAAGESSYGARSELGFNPAVKEGLMCALDAAIALGDLAKSEELLKIFDDLRPGETTLYLR